MDAVSAAVDEAEERVFRKASMDDIVVLSDENLPSSEAASNEDSIIMFE